MLSVLLLYGCLPSGLGQALSPPVAVRLVADHILNDTNAAHEFQLWGYGQSIIIDAMLHAAETVDNMDHVMARWANPVLDFLSQQGSLPTT